MVLDASNDDHGVFLVSTKQTWENAGVVADLAESPKLSAILQSSTFNTVQGNFAIAAVIAT